MTQLSTQPTGNPSTWWVEQYRNNVLLLAQQEMSLLRPFVQSGQITGAGAFEESIGEIEFEKVKTRFQPTPRTEVQHGRRYYKLDSFVAAPMIDRFDKLKQLVDPTSSYVKSVAAGAGRKFDNIIIEAAIGESANGIHGSDLQPFPESQKVNDGTPVGMDLAALRAIRRIFDDNAVRDYEKKCLVVAPSQIEALLGEEQLTSSDYNVVRALVNGQIDEFMGFRFIKSTLLPYDADTHTRTCFAFSEEALKLGLGEDYNVTIDRDITHMNNWIILATMTVGGIRLDDKRVVMINVDESA